MPGIPALSVLDLIPIAAGASPREALDNARDLARHAEGAGYRRYWVAEHHLNPGVAGTSPALVISLIASATTTIRVGSGAVQMGHHTPLSVVEQFGILDALHPGRIDLGIGRSGFRRPPDDAAFAATAPRPARRTARGLLIPEPFSFAAVVGSPRFRLQARLLQQPGAETPEYADQVDDILTMVDGSYRSADGVDAPVVPGRGADLEVWILGSSAGVSAEVAGGRALPFAANYHVSPATVLDAVEGYRAAFRPAPHRTRPYVAVSADVVVAPTDAGARRLAAGYGPWVHSIRSGAGAIAFPAPDQAEAYAWPDGGRDLVADRVDTQFVGSPERVVDLLRTLADETGADEIVVTTITHDHADRVRSYELLAEAWAEAARDAGGDGHDHAPTSLAGRAAS
jgi:alkanesulfonate monooxygenase SsuD/methylene tetrahydromethanopterin reductase-like flavin-dependent oxidoreductase (luciferase family)